MSNTVEIEGYCVRRMLERMGLGAFTSGLFHEGRKTFCHNPPTIAGYLRSSLRDLYEKILHLRGQRQDVQRWPQSLLHTMCTATLLWRFSNLNLPEIVGFWSLQQKSSVVIRKSNKIFEIFFLGPEKQFFWLIFVDFPLNGKTTNNS